MRRDFTFMGFVLVAVGVCSGQSIWQAPADTPANWTDSVNWNVGVPEPTGAGYINNGGIAEIQSGPVTCAVVRIGSVTGGHGTLRVSPNGALTNATLQIGYAANSTGTVQMTGGRMDLKGESEIGSSGTGSFTLDGGTLTAGSLAADSDVAYIGNKAGSQGTFTQNGGTNLYNGIRYYLGYAAGSTGRYILNGGLFDKPTYYIYVGNSGTGIMELNGGKLDMHGTSKIHLGYEADSSGMLVMNNWTGTLNEITFGATTGTGARTNTVVVNGGSNTIGKQCCWEVTAKAYRLLS